MWINNLREKCCYFVYDNGYKIFYLKYLFLDPLPVVPVATQNTFVVFCQYHATLSLFSSDLDPLDQQTHERTGNTLFKNLPYFLTLYADVSTQNQIC